MKIKCSMLTLAVFAISFSLIAQKPGANPKPSTPQNPGATTPTGGGTQTGSTAQTGSPSGTTAAPVNSELFVMRADSSIFTMVLDEAKFGVPAKSFNLTNLTPGFHHIQLLKPLAPNAPKVAAPEVLYDGYVNVPEASRVTAVNPERNQLNIVSIVPIIQAILGILGQGQPNQNGNNGWGQGTGNPWGWPIGPQAMAGNDFEMLKTTINGKTFDSDKLSILKMAMMNNHFSASQVTQLVSLFTFESNKVAVAKALYSKVIDKGNYYLVNNAFDFSSSSSELAEYITGFGG